MLLYRRSQALTCGNIVPHSSVNYFSTTIPLPTIADFLRPLCLLNESFGFKKCLCNICRALLLSVYLEVEALHGGIIQNAIKER